MKKENNVLSELEMSTIQGGVDNMLTSLTSSTSLTSLTSVSDDLSLKINLGCGKGNTWADCKKYCAVSSLML